MPAEGLEDLGPFEQRQSMLGVVCRLGSEAVVTFCLVFGQECAECQKASKAPEFLKK